MPLQKRAQTHSGLVNKSSNNTRDNDNFAEMQDQNALCDEEDEMEDNWLQSLGVDESVIRRLHNSQVLNLFSFE